jgi:hypothetical protein
VSRASTDEIKLTVKRDEAKCSQRAALNEAANKAAALKRKSKQLPEFREQHTKKNVER